MSKPKPIDWHHFQAIQAPFNQFLCWIMCRVEADYNERDSELADSGVYEVQGHPQGGGAVRLCGGDGRIWRLPARLCCRLNPGVQVSGRGQVFSHFHFRCSSCCMVCVFVVHNHVIMYSTVIIILLIHVPGTTPKTSDFSCFAEMGTYTTNLREVQSKSASWLNEVHLYTFWKENKTLLLNIDYWLLCYHI